MMSRIRLRLRSLAALLLLTPLQAQVLPTKAVLPILLTAPAQVFAPPVAPALLTPSAIPPSALAQPPAAPTPAPVPVAAPRRSPNSHRGKIPLGIVVGKPNRASRELEQPATPADGWASRFNFKLGRKVFDGEHRLTSDTGEVFVAVPKPDGKVRLHIAERAPLATVRPVVGTEGLSGSELLEKVAAIAASGHKAHTYTDAKLALFSKADIITIDGVQGVYDVYSGIFGPGTSGHVPGMNVEHSWPQSYFESALPMRSDLHHLMVTAEHPNSIRSNLPYGIVVGKPDYENKAGAKLGTDVNGRLVFEPPNAVKGRVARNLLYFYARYKNSPKFGYPSALFWNRQVELMLRWNREYPPDTFEARRNDYLESYQGNRNPFIDDAGLADRIGADAFRASKAPRGGASIRSRNPRNPTRTGPAQRRPVKQMRAKPRPVQKNARARPGFVPRRPAEPSPTRMSVMQAQTDKLLQKPSLVQWRYFTAIIRPIMNSGGGVNVELYYRGVRYADHTTLMSAAITHKDQQALEEFSTKLAAAVKSIEQLQMGKPLQKTSLVQWFFFTAIIGPATTAPDGTMDVSVKIYYRGVRYDNPMALMSAAIKYRDQQALREFRARLDAAVNLYRKAAASR